MIWCFLFAGVSVISALFGFGIFATAIMAQVLAVVFGLLSLACLSARLMSDGTGDWPQRRG